MTVETFLEEMAQAVKAWDKYVICLDKSPEEFEKSLHSLVAKAIKTYKERAPTFRHGIALDRRVTVILSETEGERPLCSIYFNLHSPYQKKAGSTPAKPVADS